MLENEQSLRLKLLRFPLIIGVVFIHAYGNIAVFAGNEIGVNQTSFVADFIRNFISNGVARIAVPLFFLMSGYLFFIGFKWSIQNYVTKIRSRIKTLIIPFVFWNIATLLIIALAQAIPATQIFFSGKNALIVNFSIFDYFNAIIGFTRSPIAYQFWFIRDLIILVLFAPLINIINKSVPLPFICILLLYWLTDGSPLYVPSSEAILFFSIGAYLGSKNKSLFVFDNLGFIISLLYFIIVTVDVITINQSFNPYLHKIGIVFGILCALFLTGIIVNIEKMKLLIVQLSSASFFVYAVHEPLLTILKKIAYKTIHPASSFSILCIYLFIPTITIILSLIVYRIISSISPKFVSIVTGGR